MEAIFIIYIIFSLTGILTIAFALFFLHRNEKVLDFILKTLAHNSKDRIKLPSYDKMLYKFWIPLKTKYWIKS